MSKTKNRINFIVTGALIAAAYAGLTFLSNIFSLAYGPVQFRVSEVLTLLPIFTPAAIPGVTVGCFIANIASFNAVDMIFGTAATLIAALLTYALRNITFKGLPLLAMLPPVIVNAVVIGLELAFFYLPGGYSFWGFVISGVQVGAGELAVCYALGIPFYLIVKKHNIFKENTVRSKDERRAFKTAFPYNRGGKKYPRRRSA